jgi:hypothetical protein
MEGNMIFRQVNEIINGTKTQTRRVVKPGETFSDLRTLYNAPDARPATVYTPGDKVKWQVGRTYAVVPKMSKPGVWWAPASGEWSAPEHYIVNDPCWQPLRIRITAIRREPLQDISESDAVAEGYPEVITRYTAATAPIEWYRELWDSINTRAPYRWDDNPAVWVIEFEVARDD